MSEHTWELREYLQGSSNIPEAGRTALQRFIGLSWQDLQDLNRFSDDDVDTAFMLFQHMLQALDEADQARDAAHALAWQAVLRGRHGTTG